MSSDSRGRATLLTQNSELRADRIHNWTLPAWVVTLPDGRTVNVCPQAGACAKACYALQGTYRFPAVREAHERNLLRVLDDLRGWEAQMVEELEGRRFRPSGAPRLPELPRDHLSAHVAGLLDLGAAAVRIHDAGDYFSDDYLQAWLRIAEYHPDVLFYSYTKEVERFRRLVEPYAPSNFLWVYSLGGKQDHLLDLQEDRHADVFPDWFALDHAGYRNQEENDLLCVLAPERRIGIVANRIPGFRRYLRGRPFSRMESDLHRTRRAPGATP